MASPKTTSEQSPLVQSVVHALDLLELLANEKSMAVREVADALGVSKPSAYRLLATLESRGYATQDPVSSRYSIGLGALELGMGIASGLDLRTEAASHLSALNDKSGEVVHLGVYDRGDVVYIEKLDSKLAVAPLSRIGVRAPGFCVATGRALLAYQPAEEIDRVLAGDLPLFTENTVTDPDELRRELELTRSRGHAINRSSWRDGVCGIAAPIREYTGMVVASVGVCLPESRFPARADELVKLVMTTASAISADLGHVDAPATREAVDQRAGHSAPSHQTIPS